MNDKLDLPLLICKWAERKARRAKMPVWAFVQDIICTGSGYAMRFCEDNMERNGWAKIKDKPPPAGVLVLTAEDLGDHPRALKQTIDGKWLDKKGHEMMYTPSWWKVMR